MWWDKGKVEKGRKERETVSERKRMKVMRVLKWRKMGDEGRDGWEEKLDDKKATEEKISEWMRMEGEG